MASNLVDPINRLEMNDVTKLLFNLIAEYLNASRPSCTLGLLVDVTPRVKNRKSLG